MTEPAPGPHDAELISNPRDLRTKVADPFDASWKAGAPRAIEDLLSLVAPHLRERAFNDLLGIELEYRRHRGERPSAIEYERRFPSTGRSSPRRCRHRATRRATCSSACSPSRTTSSAARPS